MDNTRTINEVLEVLLRTLPAQHYNSHLQPRFTHNNNQYHGRYRSGRTNLMGRFRRGPRRRANSSMPDKARQQSSERRRRETNEPDRAETTSKSEEPKETVQFDYTSDCSENDNGSTSRKHRYRGKRAGRSSRNRPYNGRGLTREEHTKHRHEHESNHGGTMGQQSPKRCNKKNDIAGSATVIQKAIDGEYKEKNTEYEKKSNEGNVDTNENDCLDAGQESETQDKDGPHSGLTGAATRAGDECVPLLRMDAGNKDELCEKINESSHDKVARDLADRKETENVASCSDLDKILEDILCDTIIKNGKTNTAGKEKAIKNPTPLYGNMKSLRKRKI